MGTFGLSGDAIRLRRATGFFDVGDSNQIKIGQGYTTFQDDKALPTSVVVDGTPAGSVFKLVPQLQYTRDCGHGWSWTLAIENPINSDFALPNPSTATVPGDVRLRRAPDLVSNLRFVDPTNAINRVQVGGMVRWMGYEDVGGIEHFEHGWGFMGSARMATFGQSNVQLGAVVGEGVGDYVYGLGGSMTRSRSAAGPSGSLATGLDAWKTIGCHVGYQQTLTEDLQANMAYGYAFADTGA